MLLVSMLFAILPFMLLSMLEGERILGTQARLYQAIYKMAARS